MKPITLSSLVLLAAAGLIGTVVASRGAEQASLAPPANLPSGAIEILAAQPFVVDEPFVHEWRAEKPRVNAGYLLVLKVEPDLARPRQTYEAVLYAGEQTAERCNAPEEGGVLVVLVPAPLDARGGIALDLATAPIWFGSLELPERVDAERISRELAIARASGIGAARKAARARLSFAPSDAIRTRTRGELQPYVEDLIAQFSPPR